MKIFDFIKALFKENKETVQINEFGQAKLALAQALFAKLQQCCETYAKDCKDVSEPLFSLESTVSFILKAMPVDEWEKGLKESIEIYSYKRFPSMREEAEKEHAQNRAPCIDYLKARVIPWVDSFGALNTQRTSDELLGSKSYASKISGEDAFLLTNQRLRFIDLTGCFMPLIYLRPEQLEIEYLKTEAVRMIEGDNFDVLYDFLAKGLPQIEEMGISELLSDKPGNPPGIQPT